MRISISPFHVGLTFANQLKDFFRESNFCKNGKKWQKFLLTKVSSCKVVSNWRWPMHIGLNIINFRTKSLTSYLFSSWNYWLNLKYLSFMNNVFENKPPCFYIFLTLVGYGTIPRLHQIWKTFYLVNLSPKMKLESKKLKFNNTYFIQRSLISQILIKTIVFSN